MLINKISVGAKVRPLYDDSFLDVTADSLGEVILFNEMGRHRRDFHVTIRWDNGKETFLNALFFRKTVQIVKEDTL
jgi:hypothetical protein